MVPYWSTRPHHVTRNKISDSVITGRGCLHPGLEPEKLVVKIQVFWTSPSHHHTKPIESEISSWRAQDSIFLIFSSGEVCAIRETLGWRHGMQRKTQEGVQSKLAARIVWITRSSQDLPCLPGRRTFPSAVLLIAFCGASAVCET